MKQIIAITNQKGGVGKTTTAYNLAAALARYNKKILVIDRDPQGNCSSALGIDSSLSRRTSYELLTSQVDLKHAIRRTSYSNVFLISANLSLARLESQLRKQGKSKTTLLKEKLDCKDADAFDFILIDTPPSLGFLSLNSLKAADSVIIPRQCEYFALDALAQLLSTIASVQRGDNPKLEIEGILLTRFDSRTKLVLEISQEVRKNFKDKTFTTTIPRNVSIPEAISKGIPVSLYKPLSAGSLSYLSLAREVMEYAEKKELN